MDPFVPEVLTITIDLRGLKCPMPVMRTKQHMRTMAPHDPVDILVDDPEALHDLPALFERHAWATPDIVALDGHWCVRAVAPASW